MTFTRISKHGCLALVALLTSLVWASAAAATVRYVSPSGLDTNTGTSPSAAWSLSKANGSLAAGDVCYLAAGTYSTGINPSSNGTSGARITYVGDLANPANVTVSAIDLSASYVTVKGVRTTGHAYLSWQSASKVARYDSVAYCQIGNEVYFLGAQNSIVVRNQIAGTCGFLQNSFNTLNGTSSCMYDTLRYNRIDMGVIPSGHGFKNRGYTQNCVVDSNRVTGTFTASTADGVGRIFYNSYNNYYGDNRWEFEATAAFPSGGPWNGWVLRDSSHHYTFVRDTLLMGVNSAFEIRGQLSGAGTWPGTTHDNTWSYCYFKHNSYVFAQNGFRSCGIDHSVIISKVGSAFEFPVEFTNSFLTHNTFFSNARTLIFDAFSGTNNVSSNLFYSVAPGPAGNGGGMTQYPSALPTGLTQNYNMFFSPNFTNTPGDRSLMWCCYTASRPGAGQPWNTRTGQDANSKYGSPRFVDSTFVNFDPRLNVGSLAIGAAEGGSDAGAIPFGGAGSDLTPPGTVTTLAISQVAATSLLLTWVAPGDDGASGVAQLYDLRWSNAPITVANFGAATPMAAQPLPQQGGTSQSYAVTALTAGSTYYFALKARDEGGNWSGMSNVPSATTTGTDTVPPAAVGDLSATN